MDSSELSELAGAGRRGRFLSPRMAHTLAHRRDLYRELVVRDMKLRYKRSYLGVLWTLVNPLSQLIVYHYVFRVLFKVTTPNYTAYLFIGITSWAWFSTSIIEATGAILQNKDLIRQPNFPATMLPNVTVGSHLVHFLITLPILFVLVLFSDVPLTSAVLALPLVIAVQYVLTLACSLVAACMHVRFRDTQYLISVFLMLGFFLTPILYELSIVPPELLPYYRLNPMTHIVDAYRAIFLHGELPDRQALGAVAVVSVIVLGFAHQLFGRVSSSFVEEL